MDLNKFYSTISDAQGLARSNRYAVHIPTGALFKKAHDVAVANGWDTSYFEDFEVADAIGDRLTLFCKKAELPGMQFTTDEIRYYGEAFKFPYMIAYENISFSFYVGNDMLERKFWDAWMYSVMDPNSHDFNFNVEYAMDIYIDQYNEQDESVYQVKLFDAYPVIVSQMDVSSEDDNRVHECTVTCAYKRWLPSDLGWDSTTGQPLRGTKMDFSDTLVAGKNPNLG